MTKDEQSQKLTEESCADFVDRIQLEALNRRWASVVIGRHGRSRQRGIQAPEAQAAANCSAGAGDQAESG